MDYSIDSKKIVGCDRKSKVYCSSFNTLQPLVLTDNNEMEIGGKTIDVDGMSDIDLSALGLYIGKFVEQEINSSVVQLMRYCCGIEMPDYYCKRYPGWDCDADINTGRGKWVRLNEQVPGASPYALKSIPLGDAYHALCAMNREDDEIFYNYPWLTKKEFLDTWRQLNMFRNMSAHSGDIISRKEIKRNYDVFMTFLKYMPYIADLKKELAPEGCYLESTSESTSEGLIFKSSDWQDSYVPKALACEAWEGIPDSPGDETQVEREEEGWLTEVFEGKNGMKGLKDSEGIVIVPALYDDIIPFIFWQCCLFKKDGSLAYGLLNGNGEEILPCIIDNCFSLDNNSFIFQSGDHYGLYQLEDGILLQPIYDNIEQMDELEPLLFTLDGELGYVTIEGDFVPKSQKSIVSEDEWAALEEDFIRECYMV